MHYGFSSRRHFPARSAGVSIYQACFTNCFTSQEFYLAELVLRAWARWGRAGVRAAPPSAGRRGMTLAGGSRSSRPLVKAPGGCIRRGWGRRKEVSVYIASTSAIVKSNYASAYRKNGNGINCFRALDKTLIKYTSKPKTFQKNLWGEKQPGPDRQVDSWTGENRWLTAAAGMIQRGVMTGLGCCTGGSWKINRSMLSHSVDRTNV